MTSTVITAIAGGDPLEVEVRITNRLGAGVDGGDSVRFELIPPDGLDVKRTLKVTNATGRDAGVHVFALQLVEGAGGAGGGDRRLVAVLTRKDGSEAKEEIRLTYLPQATVQASMQQAASLTKRLDGLRAEKTNVDREKVKWERDYAEANRAVQTEQAAANQAAGLSPAERIEKTRLQQELGAQQAAPLPLPECRSWTPPLKLLKRELPDLRCVFELGLVENRDDGEALAALVGQKMLAVVATTEGEKEQLLRDERYAVQQL